LVSNKCIELKLFNSKLSTMGFCSGCESKLLTQKCSIGSNNANHPPKTKSPKPHSKSHADPVGPTAPSSSGKGEEQWVDGPRVSSKSYRSQQQQNLQQQCSPGKGKKAGGSGSGGGETWIDGPAASRVHQASNFPSPKKTPFNSHSGNSSHSPSKLLMNNNNKGRKGDNVCSSECADNSCCGISSTKAEMIQKWISNQTHSSPDFFDELSFHLAEDALLFGGGGPHNGDRCCGRSAGGGGRPTNFNNHPLYEHYFRQNEPEYKALTVFKTCEDDDDESEEKVTPDPLLAPTGNSSYEVEYIEVVEPDSPVSTNDVCLQVKQSVCNVTK
jgi:hypothetical protein